MADKKTTTKKPTAKKPAAKQPATKKAAAKKPAAKKAAAKKTTASKAAPKKSAPKKTPAKKSPAKKSSAKQPAAKAGAKASAAKAGASKTKAAGKDAADAPKPRRRKVSFGVGDKVVHPHHGASTITGKIKQIVEGKRHEYFVLEVATDQLTVFVPVDRIDETIRPVISQNATRKVFSIFKEEPQEAGSNWSRWYKVLNEKMTSGDIFQVAEVVRDLTYAQQTKGISPALKRMLSRARLTLSSELSFALKIDEEEAVKRLDRALPKVEVPEEEE